MFRKKKRIGRYRPKRRIQKKKIKSSRSRERSTRSNFYKFLFIIIVAASVYLIGFSSYFKVNELNYLNSGPETEGLSQQIYDDLKDSLGKNIIFLDTNELADKIIEKYPELSEITLNKNYPSTIEFSFAEFPLSANIINETTSIKKNYIINSIGYVMKEDFENPNLSYIKIKSDEPINIEKPVIETVKLKYILNTIKYFEDKFGMIVQEVEYKPIPREIHLLTEKNFYIWLDIQRSAKEQLDKLKKALVKLDIYEEDLLYIDLRIPSVDGDKIFFKRR
ncbi:hypothetical protein GF354_06075 [Candidatus Peregrinibacteria bacterium]|nr:hypothetical protein [Candidatus Peregrinibacteria bacterium]